MSVAALAVMAGHAYPIFLKFRGGKAVASFIGAFLYLTPIPLAAVLFLFVIVVAASRHISLGSIVAAGCLPLAVWLAAKLSHDSPLWMSAAALAVMAGHAYPIFLKFHGGKAVASFIGAFLYLTPIPLAAVLFLFVIVVAASRHISLGSIVAAGCLPLAVWLIEHPPAAVLLASLIAGAFIVYRHKANIDRIRTGSEHVFRFK